MPVLRAVAAVALSLALGLVLITCSPDGEAPHTSEPVSVDACTESSGHLRLRPVAADGERAGCTAYPIPPDARGFRNIALELESGQGERGQVLLTDPSHGEVHTFDIEPGRWAGEWAPAAGYSPRAVDAVPGGHLLLVAPCSAFLLGEQGSLPFELCTDRWRLPDPSNAAEPALYLTSLYGYSSWTPDGTVIGYGTIRRQDDSTAGAGVVRMRHKTDRRALVQPELLRSAPSGFYRIGYPYFAAIGEDHYFLAMQPGQSPHLFRVSGTGAPEELPLPLQNPYRRSLPDLEEGLPSALSLLPRFYELTVIAGLYSDEKLLYVLTREPGPGGTRWLLHPLRPGEAIAEPAVELPTRAPHLNLLVTSQSWWVAERGLIAGDSREGDRLLKLPTEWIRGARSSPLLEISSLSAPRESSVSGVGQGQCRGGRGRDLFSGQN